MDKDLKVNDSEEPSDSAEGKEEAADLDPKIEEELNEHESFEEIRKVGAEVSEDMDSPRFYKNERETTYQLKGEKGGKKTLMLMIILGLLLLVILGVVFRDKVNSIFNGVAQTVQPTPTPTPTPESTPTPNPLNRSDWSFEVLNGSGITGAAKEVADQLKALGYPVIKTANADKDDYAISEIFVKEDLLEKLDPVIVDLKDVIKFASSAGELKEGTASARIIIGKDYNP